jgi:hypothetical protein
MNGTGTALARKPIHDATDNTPEVLKSVGIFAGDWFRLLKKHHDLFVSADLTDEERVFALVLGRDAFDFCDLKIAQCQREGIERPLNAPNVLLCMEPKRHNGKIVLGLLTEAERAGYDVLLTADKNIRYQQNLSGRKIAIVVLGTPHLLSGNVAAPKSFEGENETRGFSGGTIQCR